jgi:hypothetical protein
LLDEPGYGVTVMPSQRVTAPAAPSLWWVEASAMGLDHAICGAVRPGNAQAGHPTDAQPKFFPGRPSSMACRRVAHKECDPLLQKKMAPLSSGTKSKRKYDTHTGNAH